MGTTNTERSKQNKQTKSTTREESYLSEFKAIVQIF